MAIRNRVKELGTDSGSYTSSSGSTSIRTVTKGSERCNDQDGWSFHHDLLIDKFVYEGGILNGSQPGSSVMFSNYPCTARSTIIGHDTESPLPTVGGLSAKLLKKTNPSTPDVDIPLAIAELKDLPSLVRGFWSKNLLRNAADANLRWQFGVRPMLSDIRKLCNFPTLVNNRFRRLKKLASNRAEVKRVTLSEWRNASVDRTYTMHSVGALVRAHRYTYTEVIRSGYAQWLVTRDDFPSTDEELMKLATRATGGFDVSADLIWNLIPFSWLVDWYGNIGDYIAATRNTVGVTPNVTRLMRRRQSVDVASVQSKPYWLDCSDMYKQRITLERYPASLSFAASLPVLDNRQWGILGSLVALRLGRKA